jgi:hypothetical protein
MPPEPQENPPDFRIHSRAGLQLTGLIWTVAYYWMMFFYPCGGPSANDSAKAAFILLGIPALAMFVVFAILRAGGWLAFGSLALATVLALGTNTGDMKCATSALSEVFMLFAAPVVLLKAIISAILRRK